MIPLLFALIVLQDAPLVVVTREEIVLSVDQQQALMALTALGSRAGLCRQFLPTDTLATVEAGAPSSEGLSDDSGQPVLDQVFYAAYADSLQVAEERSFSRVRCEAMMEDAAAVVVAAEPFFDAIEAEMPPASARPWGALVPDAARIPRRPRPAIEPLRAPADPERAAMFGAVMTPPRWAETPRVPMPRAARSIAGSASAHIECIVTVEGRARACRLLSESVEGVGLGAAALGAEGLYRFHPRMIDDQPVEARAVFTVTFRN